MKLSPHFTLAELTVTNTGLANVPNEKQLANLRFTASRLETVRALCGDKPMVITSGFRSARVNSAVGGSKTSDHLSGLCADAKVIGLTPEQIARILLREGFDFDQLIKYRGQARLHFGFGPRNRKQLLACTSTGGYIPWRF